MIFFLFPFRIKKIVFLRKKEFEGKVENSKEVRKIFEQILNFAKII